MKPSDKDGSIPLRDEQETDPWCLAIYRGPCAEDERQGDSRFLAKVELPGGEDDAGLMESDLIVLFNALIQQAHDDLSKQEIQNCFKTALNGSFTVLPSGVLALNKKR